MIYHQQKNFFCKFKAIKLESNFVDNSNYGIHIQSTHPPHRLNVESIAKTYNVITHFRYRPHFIFCSCLFHRKIIKIEKYKKNKNRKCFFIFSASPASLSQWIRKKIPVNKLETTVAYFFFVHSKRKSTAGNWWKRQID